jgi:hypothetical protein
LKTIFPKNVIIIIAFALIVRLVFIFSVSDLKKDYYWEYGELAKNVIHGNGYSLFHFEGNELKHNYSPGIETLPSAYMPPGYAAFLLPFMAIDNIVARNILILLIQTLISLGSILLIYIFTKKYISEFSALIAVLIASFLPEFIYSVTSYTPTVIYQLLVLIIILQFKDYYDKPRNLKPVYIGLVSVMLIYFRAEFFLAFLFFLFSLIIQRKFVASSIVLLVVVFFMLPWTIRNYNVFNEFVPLTTSGGLNFYRGNNPEELGSWGNAITTKEILDIKRDSQFEINLNRVYLKHALDYIKNNPVETIRNIIIKIYHLWGVDTSDRRSYLWTYILPSLLIIVLFIAGFIASYSWERYRDIYLFFIYSTIIAAVFFTLPRYQTMMKILIIPFAAYGIEVVIKKFRSNYLS